MIYLCSPGNPTGALLNKEDIKKILEHETWNGVVVIDEAYIDFSAPGSSCAEWATQYPNVAVMQTLSKGFGLAGVRLGAIFTSEPIARLLNALKAPYNISSLTAQVAERALGKENLEFARANIGKILEQRSRLVEEIVKVPGVGRLRGGLDSNFLLVEMLDRPGGKPCNETALRVYEGLAEERGVVVRFRGKEHGCEGCLRITVGIEEEVTRFLAEIRKVLDGVFKADGHLPADEEEKREVEANEVMG